MANAPINYPVDVQPLEDDGLDDAEIAVQINKLTVNDTPTIEWRNEMSLLDGLYSDAANNLFQRGSLGEAPVQDPSGWANDPTLQRDLDRLVNFLYFSNKPWAKTRTNQRHATAQYNSLFNFRQFKYDRSTIDDEGNPITETQRRALDDAQVLAIYDLGGGFLYGPPSDGNAATAAEVTQSRVDWNQDNADAANRALNQGAVSDMTTRSQGAVDASQQALNNAADLNANNTAEITLAGETFFDNNG